MELNLESLEKLNPCSDGLTWWKMAACKTVESTIARLLSEEKLDWANWLIARVLTHDGQIRYAIFSARQVLEIYEKRYPGDNRARRAVEAAEEYLADKTEEKRQAAANAAYAAANAAYAAAYAAAHAANAAAHAANAAAYAANAAANAAKGAAANAAANAAMKKKVIEYGVSLLSERARTKNNKRHADNDTPKQSLKKRVTAVVRKALKRK